MLSSKSVLQAYHFRVNVTSRMYFEVGMHMVSSHATLQMSTLNDKGYSVQGKQRGNLNVLDLQIGPGDYTIAIKQQARPTSQEAPSCGLFSLQGLVEPISLMSASANSGDIRQRGIASCPEAANGDILPSKIHGSKSLTRGGGELHVDATGHFMRRFRNVLFKTSREYSESSPEFDRVELETVEDSLLHLSFLYSSQGDREIKVMLTDTWMLSQEVAAQSIFHLRDIEGEHVELVAEYKLSKGKHYALAVYYVGGASADHCSLYDLTLSISHSNQVAAEAKCEGDKAFDSMSSGLPRRITEDDLDREGSYSFDHLLKLSYPDDFKAVTKMRDQGAAKGGASEVLLQDIVIQLDSNFDIRTSIDFEFDEALFTLGLIEQVKDSESGHFYTDLSHEQGPLVFKQNNDHYKTVRRELVADGIESKGKDKQHILRIANRQPDLLHLVTPDGAQSCLHVSVKIFIQASRRSAQSLYSATTGRASSPPMLRACRPDESPAFVHGRSASASFDVIFNRRPYLDHEDRDKQAETDIKAAIRLKAATVSLADGTRTEVLLHPNRVTCSGKEYRDDEYHVSVFFDLREYQRAATEKLLHAQLVVMERMLVDEHGQTFSIERNLAARGLPIYVFEQNDQEQLMKEETKVVKEVIEDTVVGEQALKPAEADVMVERSDMEQKLEESRQQEQAPLKVECQCVHGTCPEGESRCSSCESGWTGPNCDTPTDAERHQVNRNGKRDYTGDGLYRPQQISDQGPSTPSSSRYSSSADQGSPTKAKRIDGDATMASVHSTALQEQLGSTGAGLPVPSTVEPTITGATDAESDSEEQAQFTYLLMFLVLAVVLYTVCGGSAPLSLPIARRGSGPPAGRKYRPLSERQDGDSDDDDEVEDSVARRRVMELSSIGQSSQSRGDGSTSAATEPASRQASS